MNVHTETRFDRAMWTFARIWAYLVALTGLVVIPIDLWLAWARRSAVAESIIGTLVHVFWGWALVSLLQFYRALRTLDPSERMAAFSSLQPVLPGQLAARRWGWQFAYAVIAVLLTMAAAPLASWLAGK
jgi:hypothetical protein